MQCVFTTDDERSLIGGRYCPRRGVRTLQSEGGSSESLESPEPLKLSSDWPAQLGSLKRVSIDQEATLRCISHRGQFNQRTCVTLYLQSKIVRQGSGEDQRSTLNLENQRRALQTRDLVRIYGAKRRELCSSPPPVIPPPEPIWV